MRKRRFTIRNVILVLFVSWILLPVAVMIVWTFTERWAWPDLLPQVISLRAVKELFGRGEMLAGIFLSSILISTVVAMLSVVIGTLTARALVLYEFKGKGFMHFMAVLPFMVPATVFAMGVQVTFIKMGLNNTAAGVILVHLICSLPYAVRLITDGTAAVGEKLEEQARVLGASVLQGFVKVTLPLLIPVLLSYFLTLLIGGGRIKTFTIIMVPYLQSGDRNIACVYSLIFFGVTLAVFAVFEKIAGLRGCLEGKDQG